MPLLQTIATIQTGPFGSQLHASDYTTDGIPCIMPTNIGENRVVEAGIARTSLEHVERLHRHRVQVGDIVYSRRGDVTKRAFITEKERGWLCGTGCLLIRPDSKQVDAKWLSYFLGTAEVKDFLVRRAVGATMPNLNTGILGSIEIPVVPLAEQQRLATILTRFDNKIELNQRMNCTLEQLGQTLFRQWFVAFEFPTKHNVYTDEKLDKILAHSLLGGGSNPIKSMIYPIISQANRKKFTSSPLRN